MSSKWLDQFQASFGASNPDWLGGDAAKFAFAVEKIYLKNGPPIKMQRAGVTAIVGPNNAGKSTVLRELTQKLAWQPGYPEPITLSVASLELHIEGAVNDLVDWLGNNSSFVVSQQSAGFQRPLVGMQGVYPLTMQWTPASQSIGTLAGFLSFYGNAEGRFGIGGSAELRESVTDPPSHPVHHLQDSRPLREKVSTIARSAFGRPLTLDTLGRTIRLRVGELDLAVPLVDDVGPDYRAAMAELRPLDQQGDGMRRFFGQILPVATATYPLIVLDEPEAFLHPPQAHSLGAQLGRLATDGQVQILVATHDRNLLTGLLDSGVEVTVVRLTQDDDGTTAHQLDAEALKALWNDPVLRYTNVLDGLFHRLVVLAEAEGDCAYLSAALDCGDADREVPKNEILFVPTGGKDGMAKVASALDAVKVPVVAAPDLDMLDDESKLKLLAEKLGAAWTAELSALWKKATENIRSKKEPATVGHVIDAITSALEADRAEPFSTEHRDAIKAHSRTNGSPWAPVKEHGLTAFKGQARTAVESLLAELDKLGLVLVHEGELERLAPGVEVRKGPGWLEAALTAKAQCNTQTQEHVGRIVAAGARLLAR